MAASTRIALLAGANPRKCVTGPTVRLPLGKWQINVHGKIDSEIAVHIGPTFIGSIHDGCELVIQKDADLGVRIVFTKPGTEEYISINALRVA